MHTDTPIKLFPEVLFQAARHNQPATAYRLWFIAKAFDQPRCGFIPAKAFRQYLAALGIPRQTIQRWLSQALSLGLFTVTGEVYCLVSWQAGAAKAGVRKVLGPIEVALDQLLGKGWLAVCWAAYLLHFEGMLSRQTLEALSGVPARTQLAYETQAGVRNIANYASYGKVEGDPLLAIRLYGQSGHYSKAGEVRRRLPNSRSCEKVEGIGLANRGRSRIINRALEIVAGNPADRSDLRLYTRNPKQSKRAIQQHKHWDGDPKHRHGFIYELSRTLSQTGVFFAIAL